MTPAQKYGTLLHASIKALLPNSKINTGTINGQFAVVVIDKGKREEHLFTDAEIDLLSREGEQIKQHAQELAAKFQALLQ